MWGEMEVRKYMDCQPTRENSQGTKVAESLVGLYWGGYMSFGQLYLARRSFSLDPGALWVKI